MSLPSYEKHYSLELLLPSRKNLERVTLFLVIPIIYTLLLIRRLIPTGAIAFGGDVLLPFNPGAYLERLAYSYNWWGDFGATLPSVFSFSSILDSTIFLTLNEGLKLTFVQAFYIYLLILSLVSFISVYYLASVIFSNDKHGFAISIVVATVYLFNPLVFSSTYKSLLYQPIEKALFYLLIAMVIRGIKLRSLNYALLAAAISFGTFIPSPVGTYHRIIFFVAFYLVLSTYVILSHKHDKIRIMKFFLFFAVIFSALSFLINLYWVLPYVAHLGEYVQLTATNPLNFFFNSWSNLDNTIRMLNDWGFWAGYVPYAEVYAKNIAVVAMTFSWPFLAFSAILLSPRNKKVLALTMATAITLFFAKGNNLPFGSIYVGLVSLNIGGIYPFKAFYTTGTVTRHILTIEYSILVGYAIIETSKRICARVRRQPVPRTQVRNTNIFEKMPKTLPAVLLPAILIVPLIFSSWPISTGELMINYYPYEKFGVKYYGVEIPADYKIGDELITHDVLESKYHPFMIRGLVLPKMYTYIATAWYFQGTSGFYNFFFKIPTVTGNSIPYGIATPKEAIDKTYQLPFNPYDKSYSLTEMPLIAALNVIPLLDAKTVTAWQIGEISVMNDSILVSAAESDAIDNYDHFDFSIAFEEPLNLTEYKFLKLKLNANVPEGKVWIGLGDSIGYTKWWRADLHVLETTEDMKTLIMSLYKWEREVNLDLSNVKSFYIRIEPPHEGNVVISDISCIATKTETVIPKELPWMTFQDDWILKDTNYDTYWAINTSSYQGRWHQIVLQLPWSENWQPYDYLTIALKENNTDLSKLRIGIGDKNGFIGWYMVSENVDLYLSSDALKVINIPITQALDLSTFDTGNVTGVWLRYYVEEFEPSQPQVLLSDIYVCKAEVDDLFWAERLALFNIVYIIVDKSVIDGTPRNLLGDVSYYIGLLNQSKYFRELFSSDNLLIYKNEMFKDEIKILPENAAIIENSSVTPTSFSMKVNASNEFKMVLPALYSDGWYASIIKNNSETDSFDISHFRAYDVLNGWNINMTGCFEMKLYYEPQRRFYYCSIISVMAFLTCLAYATYMAGRKIMRGANKDTSQMSSHGTRDKMSINIGSLR